MSVRVAEDRNIENAEKRKAQIPPELMVRTYEKKTPTYVEILDYVGNDTYKFRSYFTHPTIPELFICYITTRMFREPFSVRLPEGEITTRLVDPTEFAVKGTKSKFVDQRVTVLYVQTLPPNGFRVAIVSLEGIK